MVNRTSSRVDKIVEWISVACCLLFAFCVRILPYSVVITKNTVNFFAQDPYYHARRIQLALSNHWIIPTYDSYSGFPQGLYCFWSNLFDYSILWTGFFFGKGHPSIRQLEIITAFAPVLWGVFSLIPAYLLIKKVFNQYISLLSIFFISILPGHIYQTVLGRADHYGADAVFPLFMFYFLLNALTTPFDPPSLSKKGYRKWQVFYAGLCAALSWLVWPGSTIFVGIAIAYILIQSIFDYHQSSVSICLWTGIFFLFIAWFVISPFCITSYWGKHGIISYDSISWFQWIFLIFAIAVFTISDILQGYFKNHGYSLHAYLFGLLSTILVFIGLAYFLLPEFIESFLSGLGWVGKTDPWLQTITEFQPLFISIGVFSTYRAITYFSYIIYLLPIIYLVLFWTWMKERKISSARLFFIIYFVAISFLGLYQSRFSHFFVLVVAVGFSLLCVSFRKLGALLLNSKILNLKSQIVYELAVLYLIYLLLSPALQEISSLKSKYAVVPYPWKETLLWIRDNTPQTSYFDQPYRQPEYGILAPWITGHWINYLAHRPTLANGFHTNAENNQTDMKFLLTEDIQESKTILENNKIRYVILSDITPNVQGYARVLGKDDTDYIFESIYHPPAGGTQIVFQPTEKFHHLVSTQLYWDDGVGLDIQTTGVYRLVYETPEQWGVENKMINSIKVFEYVLGAVIQGIAKSGTPIHLSVSIKTNSGRSFLYQQDTMSSPQNAFQFILPYSQNGCPYQTHATTPYSIQVGKKTYSLNIDEKAVMQGKIINF